MTEVIDLRKKKQELSKEEPEKKETPSDSSEPRKSISWTVEEKTNPKRLIIFSISLIILGILIFFLANNILLSVVVILGGIVLILINSKNERKLKININNIGVVINDRLYLYSDIKSFWIDYVPGRMEELSLEIKKWYIPYIRIPLESTNPLEIRHLMVEYVPETRHEPSLVDVIIKRLGL